MIFTEGVMKFELKKQHHQSLIPSTDVIQITLTVKIAEDDYRTSCRNVSHCQQQQSSLRPIQDYVHPDDHTYCT